MSAMHFISAVLLAFSFFIVNIFGQTIKLVSKDGIQYSNNYWYALYIKDINPNAGHIVTVEIKDKSDSSEWTMAGGNAEGDEGTFYWFQSDNTGGWVTELSIRITLCNGHYLTFIDAIPSFNVPFEYDTNTNFADSSCDVGNTGNVIIENKDGTNEYWYAFFVNNIDAGALSKIEFKDSSDNADYVAVGDSHEYYSADIEYGTFYAFQNDNTWTLPYSIRLTNCVGEVITAENLITSFFGGIEWDFGTMFDNSCAPPTPQPTDALNPDNIWITKWNEDNEWWIALVITGEYNDIASVLLRDDGSEPYEWIYGVYNDWGNDKVWTFGTSTIQRSFVLPYTIIIIDIFDNVIYSHELITMGTEDIIYDFGTNFQFDQNPCNAYINILSITSVDGRISNDNLANHIGSYEYIGSGNYGFPEYQLVGDGPESIITLGRPSSSLELTLNLVGDGTFYFVDSLGSDVSDIMPAEDAPYTYVYLSEPIPFASEIEDDVPVSSYVWSGNNGGPSINVIATFTPEMQDLDNCGEFGFIMPTADDTADDDDDDDDNSCESTIEIISMTSDNQNAVTDSELAALTGIYTYIGTGNYGYPQYQKMGTNSMITLSRPSSSLELTLNLENIGYFFYVDGIVSDILPNDSADPTYVYIHEPLPFDPNGVTSFQWIRNGTPQLTVIAKFNEDTQNCENIGFNIPTTDDDDDCNSKIIIHSMTSNNQGQVSDSALADQTGTYEYIGVTGNIYGYPEYQKIGGTSIVTLGRPSSSLELTLNLENIGVFYYVDGITSNILPSVSAPFTYVYLYDPIPFDNDGTPDASFEWLSNGGPTITVVASFEEDLTNCNQMGFYM